MSRQNTLGTVAACGTILVAAALVVRAGPLDPPAGPVAPSYKTLEEVEPRTPVGPLTTPGDSSAVFIIDEPGSYYLAGDLSVPGNSGPSTGIVIAASNVTLDMNGFTINMPGNGTTGIRIDTARIGITIFNGQIQCSLSQINWGIDGAGAMDVRLEGVGVFDTVAGSGAVRLGSRATVERCHIENAFASIVVGADSLVQNCQIFFVQEGVQCGTRSRIVDSVISSVNGTALTAGRGSIVSGCQASVADGLGIRLLNGGIIRDCYVVEAAGIQMGGTGSIENCVIEALATGVTLGGTGISVKNCSITAATGNTGIELTGTGHSLVNCRFGGDVGLAIHALGSGHRITSCTVGPNSEGIRLEGDRIRCEGNHISEASIVGITITGDGNMVVGNTMLDCTVPLSNVGTGNRVGTVQSALGTSSLDNWAF